ncbi:MAG TPA: hypothetical protein VH062_26810 [Polyangiaceae bacterium]|nr:hypothetical protein [Polyangiaceae bacterium]
MRKLGAVLALLLLSASCGSVPDNAHATLFGGSGDAIGGASNGGSGSSSAAGGRAACSGPSCGGASCVNGVGDGCAAPTMTPPCAASQKDCGGLCVQPSPDNGCGDASCNACPGLDHATASCRDGACAFDCDAGYIENGGGCYPPPAGCADGAKNGSESDVDCGGDCPRCDSGKACASGADCLTAACVNGTCATASCDNGVQDSSETDQDCGGSACPPCAMGQRCRVGTDCVDGSCADMICRTSSCADRTRNGNETSVDCGGDCSPCGLNATCGADRDCSSGHCVDKVCRAACPSGKSSQCPSCSLGGACCRSDDFCGCVLDGSNCL